MMVDCHEIPRATNALWAPAQWVPNRAIELLTSRMDH
jgi:hypothetical protein